MSDTHNSSTRKATRDRYAIGPNGTRLRFEDLPPPDTQRWVARRKAEVVAAVRAGILSLEDACKRYGLSTEEYGSWENAIDKHGLRGLRVTRIQEYRALDHYAGLA